MGRFSLAKNPRTYKVLGVISIQKETGLQCAGFDNNGGVYPKCRVDLL